MIGGKCNDFSTLSSALRSPRYSSAPAVISTAVSASAATPAPVTIALITDQTGAAAPGWVGAASAFETRLDLQNAHGGVNGHKLVPLVLDTQTSPSQVVTAVQDALSKGAIGIVNASALFSLAYKYPYQAGVPVTGASSDGPEWGTQPYTNMFASDLGSVDPSYPSNTAYGKILKLLGGTRLGVYGYGSIPEAATVDTNVSTSFDRLGGTTVINNTSIPFGSVDFTSVALTAKQHNVDALWPNLAGNADIALAEAFKQAGVHLKAAALPVGYDPALIHSPAWSSVQGDAFEVVFHPFDQPNAGTEQMQAAMEKYQHWSKDRFPTFAEDEGWLGADLMIKGIQGAGANPSPQAVTRSLRSIKAYNGDGLLPITINYSTIFGHDTPTCVWLYRAELKGYVPVQKGPVCGTDIPKTGTPSPGSA